MTSWIALAPPRLDTTDRPGTCLRFAQTFLGAPVAHRSAWHAWLATEFKHGPEETLPDVPVLLWFEHWGRYDDGLGPYDGRPVGSLGNWGDVRIHVPGDAIYGSPISGTATGQSRVGTIGDIERGINARYVGWSEDINLLRVAAPGDAVPIVTNEDEDDMNIYFQPTNNSDPITDVDPETGKPVGKPYSRIWAGERVIGGMTFSPVWERSADGSVRRLFKAELKGIMDAYALAGRVFPLVTDINGNGVEQIMFGKRY